MTSVSLCLLLTAGAVAADPPSKPLNPAANKLCVEAVGLHMQNNPTAAYDKLKAALALEPKSRILLSYQEELEPLAAFAALDDHALKAPPEAEKSVEALARYLVGPAKNDREKARVIFRWITDRIRYDTESFFSGKRADGSAAAVLKTRQSVCDGYANLFLELAKQAGLEAVKINGYGKGYGFRPDEKITTNHAWNGVKIDGAWQIIDSTWGAGSVDGSGKFVKKLQLFHFLTPPALAAFTHHPEDAALQYLSPPVPTAEFAKWPRLAPPFFQLGLKSDELRKHLAGDKSVPNVFDYVGPRVKLVQGPLSEKLQKGTKVVFKAEAPPGVELMLMNGKQFIPMQRVGDHLTATITPDSGPLMLAMRVAAKKDDNFNGVLGYQVE